MATWKHAAWSWALLAVAVPGISLAQAESPVQRLEHYPGALERPIEEKISLGDEALLDNQLRINLEYGQDVRPRRAAPDHPLIPAIRQLLARLPPRIHALASRYVVAVYLLEDDWGTGTTEAVRDADGNWHYGYIALNLSVLDRTANAWGSWKERSAFRPDPSVKIRMTLERKPRDTVAGAVRFIFLHELGHVLGLALQAHGFWDAEELPAATRDSQFVHASWELGPEGTMVSKWSERFPRFSKLDFYRFEQAALPAGEALRIYRDLAVTNFPSLYSATNLFDDFAESFAIFVHTRLLNKPYLVNIEVDGGARFTYRSCFQRARCPKKVRAIESALAGGPVKVR